MNPYTPSSTTISLVYEGGAASLHTMDIRELAPALSAIRTIFERATAVVNGNTARVVIQVGTPQNSCLEIPLLISLHQSGVIIFGGDLVSSLFNIKALVIGLVSTLKNTRPIDSDYMESFDHAARLSIGELRTDHLLLRNLEMDAPPSALRNVNAMLSTLMDDHSARKAAYDLVAPIRNHHVDQMILKDESGELESVSRDDARRFDLPIAKGFLSDSTSRQILRLVSIHFSGQPLRWKLNDGSKDSQYTILDDLFVEDVKNGVYHFADGDLLDCDVRSIQHFANSPSSRIRKELEITRVWEHIPWGLHWSWKPR